MQKTVIQAKKGILVKKTYTEEMIVEYIENEFEKIGSYGAPIDIDFDDDFESIINHSLFHANEFSTCGTPNDYGIRLRDLDRLFDLCATLERVKVNIEKEKSLNIRK